MERFFNLWMVIGLLLVAFGWGPLWITVWMADAGLLSDPNPNPVGFGLLYWLTFFPALGFLLAGFITWRKTKGDPALVPTETPGGLLPTTPYTKPELTNKQAEYIASSSAGGAAGILYLLYMGVPGAISEHLTDLVWWPSMITNARQYAWSARNWQSFEQFRSRADTADRICKTMLIAGGALLILLFML